jgi:hypothetical protein
MRIAGAQPGIESVRAGEHGVGFQADEQHVGALSLALAAAGIGILALAPELATLEDLFFHLTEGADDAAPSSSADGGEPRAGELVGAS